MTEPLPSESASTAEAADDAAAADGAPAADPAPPEGDGAAPDKMVPVETPH